MKKPFALLTCSAFVLSGCQMITEKTETVTETRYSDLWTSAEVAADESVHTPTPQPVNPDTDPNRILTSKTDSGNREYLFADSIKQDNGKIMALVEYRYAKPQTLPSNGLPYTHNHWFEEIDCANKIRTVRTTTHYNSQGDIVDANEYPAPKLTPAQMKLLAQPDDGVIKAVCNRVGANTPTVSGSPNNPPPVAQKASDVAAPNPQNTANNPPTAQASSEVAPPTPPKEKPTEKQNKRNKKDKIKATAQQKSEQNPENKNPAEIDFINKNKEKTNETLPENANAPAKTEKVAPPPAPPAPAPQEELPDDFWTIGAPKE